MWMVALILSYFLVSEISAYTTAKSEVIKNEWVTNLDFDAAGNSYVITRLNDSNGQQYRKLYKLNSSNNLTWVIELPPPTYNGQPRSPQYETLINMLVSRRGDTYLEFYGSGKFITLIVRTGSREFEVVTQMSSSLFYLDADDDFFYCKQFFGVKVVRPDSFSAVPVRNLEGCRDKATETTIYDKSGNTYFLVRRDGKDTLALVNRTTLQDANPQATFISVTDNEEQIVEELMADGEENLWVIVSDYDAKESRTETEGFIKRFKNGILKTVLSQKDRTYHGLLRSKDKMYVIEKTKSTRSIFYINPNDEIVEMPELKNLPRDFRIDGLTDSEGQAYFFTIHFPDPEPERASPLGLAVTIKSNETKPIPITVPFKNSTEIKSAKIDFNDDLWMVTSSGDIVYLKKGETALNVRNGLKGSCDIFKNDIYFNSATKNMYFLCHNGLFIAENS